MNLTHFKGLNVFFQLDQNAPGLAMARLFLFHNADFVEMLADNVFMVADDVKPVKLRSGIALF